jgi:hypothetical protein
MANRLRADFLAGVCSITAGNPATLTTTSGVNVNIPSGYYLPIVLNPAPFGGTITASEIVYTTGVYSPGTTNFTVNRAQENTGSLGAQTNIPWISGPTVQDFGILNGMINGDFPIPTASGQYLAASASGIGTVYWHQGTAPATVSGSTIVGWIAASQISGTLSGPDVTLAGSEITGSITSATLPGSSITGSIAASQVAGSLTGATIPGSSITGSITTSQITGVFNNTVFKSPIEQSWINTTAPNGTMNLYVVTNGTSVLCTNDATGDFSFNVAATNSTTLNSLLATGQEITLAVKTLQGSTAYYCTGISVDGTSQTINWQGGTAPTQGNINGIDVYTINITKTATNTYTVLAALTKF